MGSHVNSVMSDNGFTTSVAMDLTLSNVGATDYKPSISSSGESREPIPAHDLANKQLITDQKNIVQQVIR